MRTSRIAVAGLLTIAIVHGQPGRAQDVVKDTVPGIVNLARVETTVACAGTVDSSQAMPRIKQMGFASIIDLRQASEPGANIDQERQAAEAARLRYVHVPFNGSSPDPKAAEAFLAAIRTPGAEPAFIHCVSGNRAAAMWLIKRLVVDRWDADRATTEATALGLRSAALRQFALDYAQKAQR